MPELNRRVLFAVPCLDGRVDMRFAYAMGETLRLGTQMGADFRVVYRGLNAMLQAVRNDFVKDALEHNFSDLIFIDSDQDWEPESVLKLLSHNVDCVGAAIRKKTDVEELYNVRSERVPIPQDAASGLLVVDSVGTGFLRLTRKALNALWNRSEEYRDDKGQRNRWVFDIGPVNGRLVGEDVLMCMKLADAGIRTHVDPSIVCGHFGTKDFRGDFAKWLAVREAPPITQMNTYTGERR
jgi:hypothetical protein